MRHKRGDTFQYSAVLNGVADGELAGWIPSCQIRDMRGSLVSEVVSEWVDPVAARAVLLTATDTQLWKLGAAVFDVQFTRASDGFSRSSPTVQFDIVEDVTRP